MDRPPQRPFLALLSAGALLALGACAQTGATPPQEVSTLSPLQLIGLTVESADGTRVLGSIDDLVLAPDNRLEQAIIATGAPMYPTERKVVVNTADLLYAPNRQVVILTGLTPIQFAALPPTNPDDYMLALGMVPPAGSPVRPLVRTGLEPTNWTGATIPR